MGGRTYLDSFGYVWEVSHGHPRVDDKGYVRQHWLVAENKIGRHLKRGEVVHHDNHDRADNRPDNLRVFPNARAHSEHHQREWMESGVHPNKADLTEAQVRKALQGRSTLEAARLLGVNHQTLRNRFGHLLTTRLSPKVLESEKQRICNLAKTIGPTATAQKMGCCRSAIFRALRRWKEQGE